MEIWKDIKGYEDLYQISNLGQVKSLARTTKFKHWHSEEVRQFKEIIKKPHYTQDGYLRISLCKRKKKKSYLVHRLVAMEFIPNTENKPQVNHKNGVKDDNRMENLEWVTNQENVIHSYKNGFQKALKGKANPLSKMVFQYDLQNNFVKKYYSASEAANKINVSKSCIQDCCRGKQKTSGGYIWKYEKQGGDIQNVDI